MAKGRSKRKQQKMKNKKQSSHNKNKASAVRESWVDHLEFIPVDVAATKQHNDDDDNDNDDDGDETCATHYPPISFPHQVSIISWNILAEAYCSPRSHRNLPVQYANTVFNPKKRRQRILQVMRVFADTLKVGIVCLQEVDLNVIAEQFSKLGYVGVETPRSPGGGASGSKVDSCAVFVRSDSFEILEHRVLRLDDLATYSANNYDNNGDNNNNNKVATNDDDGCGDGNINVADTSSSTFTSTMDKSSSLSASPMNANWQGLQHSFLRRNTALLVRLKHSGTGQTLVVANAHLFWNPGYEYVKLCQAHYILEQARQFVASGPGQKNEPLLLAGDLNSKPRGCTHSYLVHGRINAKLVAPWYAYHHYNIDADFDYRPKANDASVSTTQTVTASVSLSATTNQMQDNGNDKRIRSNCKDETGGDMTPPTAQESDSDKGGGDPDDDTTKTIHELTSQMSSVSLNDNKRPLGPIRYILDATLNKLCRWFRIMGIDAALETEAEEQERTRDGNLIIFDRCRDEKRTLITSSTRLMARQNCPPGSYCINPIFLPHLEVAMVHVLLTHGYELDPDVFLSRCVVCNGSICPVPEKHDKCRILTKYEAPTDHVDEMEVYQCNGCEQGYWWDDRPNSSASRVKEGAKNLLAKCLQAGVPIKEGASSGIFQGLVDIQKEREKGWDFESKGSDLLRQQLHVVDWLKNENLTCPFELASVYASDNDGDDNDNDNGGERMPFSNVTFDFVSTLDYIFYEPSKLTLDARLYVPQSFAELTGDQPERGGHLLPSDVWPSDHLACGAVLSFASSSPSTTENVKPTSHVETTKSTNNTTWESPIDDYSSVLAVSPGDEDFAAACLPIGEGTSPPTPPVSLLSPLEHGKRCACGCVPAIPSLFEMAERRKKIKEQKKLERQEQLLP